MSWASYHFGIEIPIQEYTPYIERKWPDITISLEPNDMIQAKDKSTVIVTKHLTEVGFKGKKKTEPNEQFLVLVGMATGKKFPPNQRTKIDSKKISNLRSSLKRLVSINSKDDPFCEFNEADGWRPRFKLIDKRNAGDQRAKDRAIHTPFNEDVHSNGQDRPYERSHEKDDADRFLEDNGD
jgi:hypothetical protein